MKKDELQIEKFMLQKNLICERFTKTEMRHCKTPDFKIIKDEKLCFYCEVKSIKKDDFIGGCREDPVFNRLTNDIHTAVKQFENVNPELITPNVLVFVNHDKRCGFFDLLSVITGNFHGANGKNSPIYKKFSDGRIKNEKNKIHLYIWLDDHKPMRFFWMKYNIAFFYLLCEYFGEDPNNIKILNQKKEKKGSGLKF